MRVATAFFAAALRLRVSAAFWPALFIRNQIKVQYLVTVRTEDYEVADIVVRALTINVRNFKYIRDTETAVRIAERMPRMRVFGS